ACTATLPPVVSSDATDADTAAAVAGTTGADGTVVCTLAPGTWPLSGPPGDFLAATLIYRSHGAGTAEVPHPVTLAAGDVVVCDYYFVPEDVSWQTPTPVPAAARGAQPTAPETWIPATAACDYC